MAITLSQSAKLSQDMLLTGVIEMVIKESPILQAMPFIEVVGNSLVYTQESRLPTVTFYNPGDTWAESTPTFNRVTAHLKILGGDADVDNFVRATRSNLQDLEATVVELKAKATQQAFDQTFISGDTSITSKAFDGIDRMTSGQQTVAMGNNGGVLTLDKLDEAIDKVQGGKPDILLMSRRSRRKLSALGRATGSGVLVADRNEFGRMTDFYDGIPIGTSDYVGDTQSVGANSDCSTIYAMQWGESGVCGITAPGGLTVERVGSLETKDATRIRVKWYVAIAVFNALKLAKLTGVRS